MVHCSQLTPVQPPRPLKTHPLLRFLLVKTLSSLPFSSRGPRMGSARPFSKWVSWTWKWVFHDWTWAWKQSHGAWRWQESGGPDRSKGQFNKVVETERNNCLQTPGQTDWMRVHSVLLWSLQKAELWPGRTLALSTSPARHSSSELPSSIFLLLQIPKLLSYPKEREGGKKTKPPTTAITVKKEWKNVGVFIK